MNETNQTVIITGANSGIGFEAAAQFAEAGFNKVILACRTIEKGEVTRIKLVDRIGKDVFDVVAVDVSEIDSAKAAVAVIGEKHQKIDVLVLNAAMSNGDKPSFNSNGIEMTFASTLLGHHVLAIDLLNNNKLAADAHIIIAGSEGARGDMPTMNIPDFNSFASVYFDDNLEEMHNSIWKIESPYKYQAMSTYVTGKVYVAWWAAALAAKLPKGMTVNAVSPGSVPGTNFDRNQNWLMRQMMPMMKYMPKRFGMSGTVEDGARRYVDASNFSTDVSGKFFASPRGKLVGKLEVQTNDHFLDNKNQQASWDMLTKISKVSLN